MQTFRSASMSWRWPTISCCTEPIPLSPSLPTAGACRQPPPWGCVRMVYPCSATGRPSRPGRSVWPPTTLTQKQSVRSCSRRYTTGCARWCRWGHTSPAGWTAQRSSVSQRQTPGVCPVPTDDPQEDELPFIAAVCAYAGLTLHSPQSTLEAMRDALTMQCGPLGIMPLSAQIMAMHDLVHAQGIRVLLSGLGGDEVA
jgi:hypothetical protein